MQKIISIFILVILTSCASQNKNVDNQTSIKTAFKENFDSLKSYGEGLFARSGDKTTVIKSLSSTYKDSKYSIGPEKEFANHLAESYGVFQSEELSDFLSSIRTKLISASGLANVPGKVYVDASADINAVATPDGNIYLNWGLIRYLTSEDDVAGLIAHEVAHILLAHHDSNALLDVKRKAQHAHINAIAFKLAFNDIQNNNTSSVSVNDIKSKDLSQLQGIQLLVNLSSSLISPSWQRTQEREADLLAVDLMIGAGYNPDGILNVLSILQQYENSKSKDIDHTVMLANAFNLIKEKDSAVKLQSAINLAEPFLGDSHANPNVRMKDVKTYLRKHYSETNTTPPYKTAEWNKLTNNPKLKAIYRAFDGAFAAEKHLEKGELKEAKSMASRTIGRAKNQSYPAFVYANILDATKSSKKADSILSFASGSKQSSGIIFHRLASKKSEKGKHAEALKIIQDAYEKFDSPPSLLPQLIRYKRLAGEIKEARLLANKCAFEHTDYKDACFEELS